MSSTNLLRHVYNLAPLTTVTTAIKNALNYPSVITFNRVGVLSTGQIFSLGSYLGGGGKKIGIIQSTLSGVNCNVVPETTFYPMTTSLLTTTMV